MADSAASAAAPVAKIKRVRKANFSLAERTCIIDNYEKHREILTSKYTNSLTKKRKREQWQAITNMVNSFGVANRTPKEVKFKWIDLYGDVRR